MSHNSDYAPPSDGFLDGAQRWADDKIHGAYKSAFKGLLRVSATGFGKGVIATALVAVVGIALLGGIDLPAATGGELLKGALSHATKIFTSGQGLAILGAGGLLGAAVSAHGEHKRISAKQAEEMAKYYEVMREKNARAQEKSPTIAVEEDHCRGGHCDKLLHERQKHAQTAQQVAR
jgi:hypothetical protein